MGVEKPTNPLILTKPYFCPHFTNDRKAKFREVKLLAQSHTASEWRSQDLNCGLCGTKPGVTW